MRKKIIDVIKAVGLNIDDFIIGYGARGSFSEIHFHPNRNNLGIGKRKAYSIQYCDNIVAIWEIGKRIDKSASIDLYWKELCWRDIHELRIKEVWIKGKEDSTLVAVMPLDCFETYLRYAFDETDKEKCYINRKEGDVVELFTTRYERDPKLRTLAIDIHGTICMVCGFSYRKKYGKLGEGFIEVHHIKPLSEGIREVNPETDMVCICSNCHRMIHRKRDYVMTVDELKSLVKGT